MRRTSKQPAALSDAEIARVNAARAAARKRFARFASDEAARMEPAAPIDADNPPLTDDELARLRPAADVVPRLVAARLRSKGDQPSLAVPKVPVSIRLDADLVETLRASGEGWQTRVNATLRRAYHLEVVPPVPADGIGSRSEAGVDPDDAAVSELRSA